MGESPAFGLLQRHAWAEERLSVSVWRKEDSIWVGDSQCSDPAQSEIPGPMVRMKADFVDRTNAEGFVANEGPSKTVGIRCRLVDDQHSSVANESCGE